MDRLKIIFIGTADFGIPSLRALAKDENIDIIKVITQPDRPAGRKMKLSPPPIKIEAEKLGLKVEQPESIHDTQYTIHDIDLIVVIAYAQLIPEKVLNSAKFGAFNLHGSLLPQYRGAACVAWPIINGDPTTGVSIIKMSPHYDTGPILSRAEISIQKDDTTHSLTEKLAKAGAGIIMPTIKDYIAGNIKPQEQDESRANYVKRIKKEDARVDWQKSAPEIERFIRAMQTWPIAFGEYQDMRIKILKAEQEPIAINKYEPGELFEYENGLAIQCAQDALLINEVQPAGKKPISGKDFIRGYQELLGKKLS